MNPITDSEWNDYKKWWRSHGEWEPGHQENLYVEHPILTASMEMSNSVIGVIDVKQMRYLYLSPNIDTIYGWPREKYYKEGVEFSFNTLPAAIQKGVLQFSQLINNYFHSLSFADKRNYRAYLEYGVKRSDNVVVSILQQDSVLQVAEDGTIKIKLVLSSNIGNYKPDRNLHLRLTNGRENKLYKYSLKSEMIIPLIALSEREMEIATLFSKSLALKEIADQLSLSFNTIKNHSTNMMKKLDVHDTLELVNLLRIWGFI